MIKRDVKNLAILQDRDAELRVIRQRVRKGDESLKNQLLIHEGLLYIANSKEGPPLDSVCAPRIRRQNS
jgi:hypothetical protein